MPAENTSLAEKWVARFTWLFLVGAVAWAVCLLRSSTAPLPLSTQGPAPASASLIWAEPADVAVVDWAIVQQQSLAQKPPSGALADRFRLAGTFFEFGPTENRRRNAILDDRKTGSHHIVSEKDTIDDVTVVSIFLDRVVLRDAAGDVELWLNFAGGNAGGIRDNGPQGQNGPDTGEIPADRFGGRRVGPNRWVFDRKALVRYYQELRDEPERLVKVFDSLDPLYDDVGAITGYQLGAEGEKDFFAAAGLKDGDVVRRVNSVPMTNRRRAEFFISQFINNGANAFAVEVEREDSDVKLIYEIRD